MSKKKSKGINVTVSLEAHEVMVKEANKHKPHKKLRAIINIKNNLPEEL